MFSESETARLKSLFKKLERTIEISLYLADRNLFTRRIESLVSELCRLSEGKCISISCAPDPTLAATPCFKIGAGGRANITYAALPTGHQFAPFLKILERIGDGGYTVPDRESSPDASPAELIILISDSCPRCPLLVEAAGLSFCGDPGVAVSYVDVMQFQEFVTKYRILSVPATVLDGQVVATGTISAQKLMELVGNRGTQDLEKEAVRSLIETQQIDEAARHLGSEAGQTVMLELIQDAEFSKRLSALVVFEQAIEEDPDAVRAMVPSLLPLLKHSDARIRGDVADLIGKIGDPQAIPHLEPLLSDSDPDVVEAAEDALGDLKKDGSAG